MGTHNREDELIAIDAKCPDTVEMFGNITATEIEAVHAHRGSELRAAVNEIYGAPILNFIDKSIADDFPKQIDQRNNPEE